MVIDERGRAAFLREDADGPVVATGIISDLHKVALHLGVVSERIEILHGRISPVLTPSLPAMPSANNNPSVQQAPPQDSEMRTHIAMLDQYIGEIETRLVEITERVQL